MLKNIRSLRFLLLSIVCIFLFAVPIFFLWLNDPHPSKWYLTGVIVASFAGIAYLKRFIDENRMYKK